MTSPCKCAHEQEGTCQWLPLDSAATPCVSGPASTVHFGLPNLHDHVGLLLTINLPCVSARLSRGSAFLQNPDSYTCRSLCICFLHAQPSYEEVLPCPHFAVRTQVRKSEGTWQAVASPGRKPRSVCFQRPPFLFHPGVHTAADAPSTVLTSHLDAPTCAGASPTSDVTLPWELRIK